MHSFNKLLVGWIIFIGGLIACRIYFTGELLFIFLIWNLFLAWIPFYTSTKLQQLKNQPWAQYAVLLIWLLFFPNSLYIITDLIHVGRATGAPKWYDATLLFSAALLGLLLAFVSLYQVEKFLQRKMNPQLVNAFVILILFLGSFGVYLGRFLRWNSWNILNKPLDLFISIGDRILNPIVNWYTWGVTCMLTILFFLIYYSAKKMPGYFSRATHRL